MQKKNSTVNENIIKELFKNGLNRGAEKGFAFFEDYIDFFSNSNSDNDKILENIKKRTGNNPDLLPAEISSLFLYYYDADGKERNNAELAVKKADDQKDRIILLCTETADSVLCALIIKKIIEKSDYFKNKCKVLKITEKNDQYSYENGIVVIKNLDMVNKADKWVEPEHGHLKVGCGLYNLKKYFEYCVKKYSNNILIIRTGSYKELSADLLLIAAEFGLSTFYLFENTEVAVRNKIIQRQAELTTQIFKKSSITGRRN